MRDSNPRPEARRCICTGWRVPCAWHCGNANTAARGSMRPTRKAAREASFDWIRRWRIGLTSWPVVARMSESRVTLTASVASRLRNEQVSSAPALSASAAILAILSAEKIASSVPTGTTIGCAETASGRCDRQTYFGSIHGWRQGSVGGSDARSGTASAMVFSLTSSNEWSSFVGGSEGRNKGDRSTKVCSVASSK